MRIPYDQLHPGCQVCVEKNKAKHNIVDEHSGRVLYKKGEFPIECEGIPKDPEEHLVQITDPRIIDMMGGDEGIRQLARLQDPGLWAYDHVTVLDAETKDRGPWVPQGATEENIEKYDLPGDSRYYQELITRCTARRQVSRCGRRCMPAGELVTMADGTLKPIEEIQAGDYVTAMNTSEASLVQEKVLSTFNNGVQQIYQISLENGSSIRCTSNHPVLKSTQKKLIDVLREWVSIEGGLKVGDKVTTVYKRHDKRFFRAVKITSIEKLDREPTYDIEVDKWHNFIVDGAIVHNSGKSYGLALKVLHRMVTNEGYHVLLIAPGLSHIDNIFDILNGYLESSSILKQSKHRFVRTPFRALELKNGSRCRGFVSGGDQVRGQRGDMIVIDEAAYVEDGDLQAVTAILTEHKGTILTVASTPDGSREQFWKWDVDPTYKSFHFPSMCRPIWDDHMEIEMRKEYSGPKYLLEVRAEHGDIGQGVFQHDHVDRALHNGDYHYYESILDPGWVYMMGIDWNPVHGTEIIIVGADRQLDKPMYTVVDAGTVFREGHTQTQAMQEIIRMNDKWQPQAIYVDKGAGNVQMELLEQIGYNAQPGSPRARLREIITAVDFGSRVQITHPVTGVQKTDYAKPLVVENAVRVFEAEQIQLCRDDRELERQLRGFIVDKIGSGGRQVYGTISKELKDHRLDAFILALFAFMMEFSKMGKPMLRWDVTITETLRNITDNLAVGAHPGKPNTDIRPKPRDPQKREDPLDREREIELQYGYLRPEEIKTSEVNPANKSTRYIPFRPTSRRQTPSKSISRKPIKRSNIR